MNRFYHNKYKWLFDQFNVNHTLLEIIIFNVRAKVILKGLFDDDFLIFQVPNASMLRGQDTPHIDPYFQTNQTVQIRETAMLMCKIYNVANR